MIGIPEFFLHRILKRHLRIRIEQGEFTSKRFDGTDAWQVLDQVFLQRFPSVVDADGDLELYHRACQGGKVQSKEAVFFPVSLLSMPHGSVCALCHVGTDSAVGSPLLQPCRFRLEPTCRQSSHVVPLPAK